MAGRLPNQESKLHLNVHSKIQAAAKSKGQTDTFYFYLLLLITEKKQEQFA